MAKRATITDVAKKAGVSVATVSRFFADSGYPVSKQAGSRIQSAARQLDYTPNVVGRMLKTNTSKDIGVIIPTIRNPFYPEVLLGIEKTAAARGYQILLCNSLRNIATEKKYIDSLYQKQVRGIIIAGADGSAAHYREMTLKGMQLLALDSDESGACCASIYYDYRKSGVIMARHLKEMGHINVAFVTSPLTKQSRKDILAGVAEVLDIRRENIIIDGTELETESGIYEYEMGRRLSSEVLALKARPTAVIAVNDITAAGVIKGLSESGIRVPEDMSVAGFDNIDLSAMISPPLTTVNQPGFETGALAADTLIDMIEGKETERINIEPELIKRASVSRIGGKKHE